MHKLIDDLPAMLDSGIFPNYAEDRTFGAYLILHVKSGKVYVGSTNNLHGRQIRHLYLLKTGTNTNKNLQSAYDSDPELRWLRFATHTREEAYEYEQALLDHPALVDKLLNIAVDAKKAGFNLDRSLETRAKIAASLRGRKMSDETKEKQRQSHLRLYRPEILVMLNDVANLQLRPTNMLRSHPVIVDGVEYESISECGRQHDIQAKSVIDRIESTSPRFTGWMYKRDTGPPVPVSKTPISTTENDALCERRSSLMQT